LSAAGLYEPERRAFRPHATVARLRARERAPRELGIGGPEPIVFDGEAVTLYRSRLSRAGARYEPLERVVLG
jgi:2'-5' RNA ligase